jgi:hypothetical protein
LYFSVPVEKFWDRTLSRAAHRFHGPPDKFSVRAPQTFSAHRSSSIFAVKLKPIVIGLKSLFLQFIFHYFKFKNLKELLWKSITGTVDSTYGHAPQTVRWEFQA